MYKNKITDVFFDLDHTLWDFDKNSALAFGRVFKKHKVELPLADFIKVYEPINLEYWKKYREEKVTKTELRRGRLNETFSVFKLSFPTETIDLLADCYIEELPGDNHLFIGTIEILDYLHSKYKLHIITNGFEEIQYLKLQNSDIQHYFETVTSADQVGVKKPHPAIFETALKNASVDPKNTIMIGDSFEADILGAEKVGMHTLFFNYRKEVFEKSSLAVHQLSEIRNYL